MYLFYIIILFWSGYCNVMASVCKLTESVIYISDTAETYNKKSKKENMKQGNRSCQELQSSDNITSRNKTSH